MLDAFRGPSGQISMRRVVAFIYAVAGIAAGFLCVLHGESDWKAISAAFGIPSLVSVVLLLFTTWGDLSRTIDAVKGNNQVTITKTEIEDKSKEIKPQLD